MVEDVLFGEKALLLRIVSYNNFEVLLPFDVRVLGALDICRGARAVSGYIKDMGVRYE